MAITSYNGILVDGKIPSGAVDGVPTGGTLIEDEIIYDWGDGGHTAKEFYVRKATYGYDNRLADDIIVGDIVTSIEGGSGITITNFYELDTGYYVLNNTYILRHVIDLYNTSYFCMLVSPSAYFSELVNQIGNSYTPKKYIGPVDSLDFINYSLNDGEFAVVCYWNDNNDTYTDTGNTTGTTINLGRWYGYKFTNETLADDYLSSFDPDIPIDIIISIPGPGIIGIILDPDTGVITTIITGDVTGVDIDTGGIIIDGEIYTGEDIPDDITTLIPETITADTLSTTKLMPKMWRSRTITTQPGITQGHEPMYLSTGISMNEMKGQRMMDIFTRMPSSNPNTRD